MLELIVQNDKKQIVLGLEPMGHYWSALATLMTSEGISVVQVNPYVVKQSKDIEDNSQLKDDRKNLKLIANLVKYANYGMLHLTEDIIRNINRLNREMKIFFPEYVDAFGKLEGT